MVWIAWISTKIMVDHPSSDVVPAMFAKTPEAKCLHVDIQIMGVWLMMLMLMITVFMIIPISEKRKPSTKHSTNHGTW